MKEKKMSRGRTIINDILPHLEDAGGRPVTSDSIAKKLKEDPSRVRDSLQNYQRTYPNGPVERVGSGIFRWRDESPMPVSGAPVSVPTHIAHDETHAVLNGRVNPPGHTMKTFEVVTQKVNVLVMLDEDLEIWVAKKVQS